MRSSLPGFCPAVYPRGVCRAGGNSRTRPSGGGRGGTLDALLHVQNAAVAAMRIDSHPLHGAQNSIRTTIVQIDTPARRNAAILIKTVTPLGQFGAPVRQGLALDGRHTGRIDNGFHCDMARRRCHIGKRRNDFSQDPAVGHDILGPHLQKVVEGPCNHVAFFDFG